MTSLTKFVKAEAERLGFDLVGITSPEPPPHYAIYQRWLERGHHGEMAYMGTERNRNRRADPKNILPECRSILVLGIRYPDPASQAPSGDNLYGRVASYAWGDDYHDKLVEKMEALVEAIETKAGRPIPNRWYTDTGPILERDFAQRAGLGWIGKNTCLIHPEKGSYFFLAEILLGIELEVDAPFTADRCGSCTRCIEACPTDCILPDRTVDATRCISYLTIELKGSIPKDMRAQMEDWVFGCDICQIVCPWNERFSTPEGDTAFAPRSGVPYPDLIEELALTPQAFNRKFKGSPVKRTKRRGYLRNVAVVLGNHGNPEAIPALTRALRTDPEPLVRAHAAWALGQIDASAARESLRAARQNEDHAGVLEEIRGALST